MIQGKPGGPLPPRKREAGPPRRLGQPSPAVERRCLGPPVPQGLYQKTHRGDHGAEDEAGEQDRRAADRLEERSGILRGRRRRFSLATKSWGTTDPAIAAVLYDVQIGDLKSKRRGTGVPGRSGARLSPSSSSITS